MLRTLKTHCDLRSQQQRAVCGPRHGGPTEMGGGGAGLRRAEHAPRRPGGSGAGQRAVLPAIPCGDHRSQPAGRGPPWDVLARCSWPPPLMWALAGRGSSLTTGEKDECAALRWGPWKLRYSSGPY